MMAPFIACKTVPKHCLPRESMVMGGVKLFGALRCAPFQSLISVKPAERQLRDVDAVFLFTTAALLPGLALCKCLLSNSSSDLPFSIAFSLFPSLAFFVLVLCPLLLLLSSPSLSNRNENISAYNGEGRFGSIGLLRVNKEAMPSSASL